MKGLPAIKNGSGWCVQRTPSRSEEHTSELQSPCNLVCRLLLEKKNNSERGDCTFHQRRRARRDHSLFATGRPQVDQKKCNGNTARRSSSTLPHSVRPHKRLTAG